MIVTELTLKYDTPPRHLVVSQTDWLKITFCDSRLVSVDSTVRVWADDRPRKAEFDIRDSRRASIMCYQGERRMSRKPEVLSRTTSSARGGETSSDSACRDSHLFSEILDTFFLAQLRRLRVQSTSQPNPAVLAMLLSNLDLSWTRD